MMLALVCIYAFYRILSYIQIKQIDVADVIVGVCVETTPRKLWFGNQIGRAHV